MVGLRTFRLADGGCAIVVRGDLDGDAVETIADEVRSCTGAPIVVDLRNALLVDPRALDALIASVQTTFVAERPLRDALVAGGAPRVAPDLRAAFAV